MAEPRTGRDFIKHELFTSHKTTAHALDDALADCAVRIASDDAEGSGEASVSRRPGRSPDA
jgi:hypothetical protein